MSDAALFIAGLLLGAPLGMLALAIVSSNREEKPHE